MGTNYQTAYACRNRINAIKNEIRSYQMFISAKEKQIAQLEIRMKEIEKYKEEHSIFERTLIRYINKDTRTVQLLDEFEKLTTNGIKRYDRLRDKGAWTYNKGRRYQFIIERVEGRECVGDITMSQYKSQKGYELNALLKYARKQIQEYINANGDSPAEILFTKPYLIRGQKSSNRTGYGSEYNGHTLVKQGTLYGETTNYAIVGVNFIA